MEAITPSLVLVNFDMPYTVSGVSDRYYYGTGIVADAEHGWVVVDRNTVPVSMGDVRLTFAGSLEVPGHVEYIHPLHNLAVISYDPKLIGNTPVKSATFVQKKLEPGEGVAVVGLGPDNNLLSQSAQVATVQPANLPLSRTLRFRDTNLEVATLVNGPTDFDGTIVDMQGRVLGMWASFAYQTGRDLTQVNLGIQSDLIVDMLKHLRRPRACALARGRVAADAACDRAQARTLPDSWVQRYEAHNAERREVLSVGTTVANTPASKFFRSGDILLSIDGAARGHVPRGGARGAEADGRSHSVARRQRGNRQSRYRAARRARHRARGRRGPAR